MSQHRFKTAEGSMCFVGWDSPMGTFFLDIEDNSGELVGSFGDTPGEYAELEDLVNAAGEAGWPVEPILDLRETLEADREEEGTDTNRVFYSSGLADRIMGTPRGTQARLAEKG